MGVGDGRWIGDGRWVGVAAAGHGTGHRGQAPSLPSAGGRATDRHGRGVTARGGAPAHGVGPGSRGKPSKDKPPKGEAGKDKAGTDKPKAKPAKGKVTEA